MILVRDVFQAKYGKSGELVALFKEAGQKWPDAMQYGRRVLTDASGSFFTVVTETEVESLAAWEQLIADVFSNPEFSEWFGRMQALVESGRREFYTAELPKFDEHIRVLQVRRTGKGCLSYLIGSGAEAAVIDAALDADVYRSLAAEHGWRITAVLDTHIHADHLSRSRQLAELAGATFYLPTQERVAFPFTRLHDGDAISIGTAQLVALHTPGHTLESTSYLLNNRVLFTGDTLFLNAVGRPDLEASPDEARKRAHLLYESLQRLLTLSPDTLISPGHTSTPPAFDGQPLVCTLDAVRAAIPRLQLPASAFVAEILARIPPTPPNHKQIVAINENGAGVPADPATLEAGANRCAVA